MKAHVKAYIPKAQRELRSVVVTLPSNYPVNLGFMSDGQFERWARSSCNKEKLKRFGKEVAAKFSLRKPIVRQAGISHNVRCFLHIYEGSGTPAEKKLFKRVKEYVEANAPKAGPNEKPIFLSRLW